MSGVAVDYFAVLGVERRPWLDAAELQRRFLALSSQCHPDSAVAAPAPRSGGDEGVPSDAEAQFARLNTAHQVLRETRSRLSHLLELETGAVPPRVQAVHGALADLFFQVGALCRNVDGYLMEKSRATSPLARAGLFSRGLEFVARVQDLRQAIDARQAAFDGELKTLDATWADVPDKPWARLEEMSRQLSYLNRWSAQLHERFVQLAV